MRKTPKSPGEKVVKDIKRATRKHYSSEEKIRIVLDGLRGEDSIAELCRREGISQGIYYKWSKDFMEAGKKRLAGDTARAANTDEVKELRREAKDLKEVVAEQTLELRLLKKSMTGDGGDQVHVVHKPRLLSDNGSSYVSGDLAAWLKDKGMKHSRGAPYHPQTQGKIERWHQTLKNRILLENYFLPGDLEAQIEAFVDHYNHQRYHESINNVTPADAYFGRDKAILKQRERIKRKTLETRRLHHRQRAA